MLSKNDKKWLREMVQEEITKALTVKVKFEKRRNLDTGQPLAVPEIEVRDVYLPAHWVEFLPFHEAALRGVQETTDHAKNNAVKSVQAIEIISSIMLGMENNVKSIGQFAGEITNRIEQKKFIKIEGDKNYE
jgi:hypothetical protein